MRKLFVVLSVIAAAILLIPVTSDAAQVNCPSCGGKGYNEKRIVTPNYSGDPNHHDKWVKEDCWRCRGTGKVEV